MFIIFELQFINMRNLLDEYEKKINDCNIMVSAAQSEKKLVEDSCESLKKNLKDTEREKSLLKDQ